MVHLTDALVSPTSSSSSGEEDKGEEEASSILIFQPIVLLQKKKQRQFFQTVFYFIFFFSFSTLKLLPIAFALNNQLQCLDNLFVCAVNYKCRRGKMPASSSHYLSAVATRREKNLSAPHSGGGRAEEPGW